MCFFVMYSIKKLFDCSSILLKSLDFCDISRNSINHRIFDFELFIGKRKELQVVKADVKKISIRRIEDEFESASRGEKRCCVLLGNSTNRALGNESACF